MAIPLRQSTASQEVPIGYFVDSTNGDSEETDLTILNTDIKLWKHGATSLVNKNSGGATHMVNGVYYAVLDATDSNTLGGLILFVHVSGALACKVECVVLPANIYDAFIANTDKLQVDLNQIYGSESDQLKFRDFVQACYDDTEKKVWSNVGLIHDSSSAADRLEDFMVNGYDYTNKRVFSDLKALAGVVQSLTDLKDFADAGYDPATHKVEGVKTVDVNTDMRGTDNAALATALTTHDGKLDTVDGIVDVIQGHLENGTYGLSALENLVDELESRLTAARAGYLDKLNVTGALAHSDAADTYKADVSGLSTFDPTTQEVDIGKVKGVAVAGVNDFKADVSGLATSSALTTHDGKLDTVDGIVDVIQGHLENGTYGLSALETLVDELESRLTAARAGYLDKLNVSGTLAHSNDAGTYKADVATALAAIGLDHLLSVSVTGTDVTNDSIIAKMLSKAGTADFDTYDNTTDSLEALRDNMSGSDVGAIADAVWDELRSGHTSVGSFGEGVIVVTNSDKTGYALTSAYDAAKTAASASALSTHDGKLDIVDSVADAVKVVTDKLNGMIEDVSGNRFKEHALEEAPTGGASGGGAITFPYYLYDEDEGGEPDTSSPIMGALVWVTTDEEGSNVVASGSTNMYGKVVFYLDAGTVYLWRKKSGWNFTNPDTEVVS